MLEELQQFFGYYSKYGEEIRKKDLFNFLKIYTNIVHPSKDDLVSFHELKNCLTNDDYDAVFDAIEKERSITKTILNKTPHREPIRVKFLQDIFPTVNVKDLERDNIKIIESLIGAGIAKLYLIAGKRDGQEKEIDDAYNHYRENSYVLVQRAHAKTIEYEDRARDLPGAEREFKKAIRLIETEKQFESRKDLQLRIKFESLLGLGYIYFTKGMKHKADEQYTKAEELIKSLVDVDKHTHKDQFKCYLSSLMSINKGRNMIVNGNNVEMKKVPDLFNSMLLNIKKLNEYEFVELASRAHTDLGVFYLRDLRFDKAETEFYKAIELKSDNPHARYNLGVLYYKKGDKERGVESIRSARNLDPHFKEAKQGLEKIDASETRNLGVEWINWWFNRENMKEKRKLINWIKPVIAISLFFLIATSVGKLSYDLYFHDLIFGINNSKSPSKMDENAFLILFAIVIVILLLRYINKLKLGMVELETESTGMRPACPASVAVGSESVDTVDTGMKVDKFLGTLWI